MTDIKDGQVMTLTLLTGNHERKMMKRRIIGSAIAVAALGLPLLGGSASAAGIVPPENPTANIPKALYQGACYKAPSTISGKQECINQDLYAINYGRASEGLDPMILPKNYGTMPLREQQWVVTNLERNDRGIAPFAGLYSVADADANRGAKIDTDPTSTVVDTRQTGAIWSGSANALGSDVLWMYYDGPGGANGDCTTTNTSGCWGRRDNILGDWVTSGALLQFMGASSLPGKSEAQEFGTLNADATANPNDTTFPTLSFPDNNLPGIVNLSGHQQDPGDRLIINGVGFTGATKVTIGGVLADDVSVQSDSEIDLTIPKGPQGTVNVVVTSPVGRSVTATGITTITYN
jgi:IPT/TIG domain